MRLYKIAAFLRSTNDLEQLVFKLLSTINKTTTCNLVYAKGVRSFAAWKIISND